MSQASEQIAKQAQVTYLDYKKIKGFEDVGYFLTNYVVSGGVVTKNIKQNDMIDVSEIVVVINNDVMRRDGTSFKTKTPNTTYYLDFTKDGDFAWGTSHPSGTAGTDYLTIAEVSTDSNGNVATITDKAGIRGGFRLKSEYGLANYMRPVFNVLDYGAKGDGIVDDTFSIQNMFDACRLRGGGYCFIPKGVYRVTSIMKIPSNTFVEMDKDTIIFRDSDTNSIFMNDLDGVTGGYNASFNITIKGGTIDCNKAQFPSACSPFAFGHMTGLHIEGVTFQNLNDWHYIEINACKDVYVGHCHFKDYAGNGSGGGSEMVQLDYAFSAGFPWIGPWDNTTCDDVTIEHCVFENGTDGIGSHSLTPAGTFHTNVTIRNNTFRNFSGIAIKTLAYQHLLIEGNHIENCFRGIVLQPGNNPVDFKILNNTMRNFKVNDQARGILVTSHSKGIIKGNFIDGCRRHGIGPDWCEDTVVAENVVVNTGGAGLWVYGMKRSIIANNVLHGNGSVPEIGYSWDMIVGVGADDPSLLTEDVVIIGNNLDKAIVWGYTNRVSLANNIITTSIGYSGTNVEFSASGDHAHLWAALPHANDWSDYGADNPPCQYRKDASGMVHLRGTAKSGATSFGVIMAGQLPAGYRPAYSIVRDVIISTGSGEQMGRITIHTDGYISYRGPDTPVNWLQYNGISFLAEQ